MMDEMKKQGLEPITKEQGDEMNKEINGYKYLECSAKTQDGVAAIFDQAVRYVLLYKE